MPAPWPTFDHSQGDSLTNLVLITSFDRFRPKGYWESCNKFGSLIPAENLVEFKPGTFWFWLQLLNPLGHLWRLRLWRHYFCSWHHQQNSHGPSYFVDVIVWSKFGNSNIVVREVIITPILYTVGRGVWTAFFMKAPYIVYPPF